MLLILGLGNPGTRYQNTRHNAGFILLDKIASHYNANWNNKKNFFSDYASCTIQTSSGQSKLLLAKPTTFMNLSGKAAGGIMSYYKISPDNLLVVHDDLELERGKIKYKFAAGHGGHNGLRSISDATGGAQYHRVRAGIGRPDGMQDVSSYVLSDFPGGELDNLDAIAGRLIGALPLYAEKNFQEFSNNLNN